MMAVVLAADTHPDSNSNHPSHLFYFDSYLRSKDDADTFLQDHMTKTRPSIECVGLFKIFFHQQPYHGPIETGNRLVHSIPIRGLLSPPQSPKL